MPSPEPSSSLIPSTSNAPSSAPSSARTREIKTLLLTISDADALNNEDSPQGKAYDWVNFGDPIDPQLRPGKDDDQIIQRYTLGVLYFAINGDNWYDSTGWLGGTSECEWNGVRCSSSVVTATTLDLNDNQLNGGTIPPELLGNLSNLTFGNGNGKFQVSVSGTVGYLCIYIIYRVRLVIIPCSYLFFFSLVYFVHSQSNVIDIQLQSFPWKITTSMAPFLSSSAL